MGRCGTEGKSAELRAGKCTVGSTLRAAEASGNCVTCLTRLCAAVYAGTNYVCAHESSIRCLEGIVKRGAKWVEAMTGARAIRSPRPHPRSPRSSTRSGISFGFFYVRSSRSLHLPQLRLSRKRVPAESDLRNLGIPAATQWNDRRHRARGSHVSPARTYRDEQNFLIFIYGRHTSAEHRVSVAYVTFSRRIRVIEQLAIDTSSRETSNVSSIVEQSATT